MSYLFAYVKMVTIPIKSKLKPFLYYKSKQGYLAGNL